MQFTQCIHAQHPWGPVAPYQMLLLREIDEDPSEDGGLQSLLTIGIIACYDKVKSCFSVSSSFLPPFLYGINSCRTTEWVSKGANPAENLPSWGFDEFVREKTEISITV